MTNCRKLTTIWRKKRKKILKFAKNFFVLIYSITFVLFLFVLARYWKLFQVEGLSPWTFPAVFLLKVGVGLLLFLIHIQTYNIDDLSHDGGTFLIESKYLNDVFYQSPKHYFQLLTGIGETTELINKYLYMTEYWSAGDLTLINDSKNVIRIHSIIHFFSGKSAVIHLAVLCLISTLALKNFYISFRKYSSQTNAVFFWVLVLVPSVIFWTSSLLKEPFLFLGISLLVRVILINDVLIKRIFFFVISIVILLMFKPYILACIVLSLLCLIVFKYLLKGKLIPTILSLVSILLFLGITFQKPRDKIVNYLTRKQFDFVNVGKGGLHVLSDSCFYYFQPDQYKNLKMIGNEVILINETDAYIFKFGSTERPLPVHLKPTGKKWKRVYFTIGCASYIETTPIKNSAIQLIKNTPESLINSVLRPFPNDPGSKLKFLSFVEVWVILLFFGLTIYFRKKLNFEEKNIVFTLLTFALILSLLIGWTTPVLGAIIRYRFPAQFALIIAGLILLKPLKDIKWKNTSS